MKPIRNATVDHTSTIMYYVIHKPMCNDDTINK
jgi:hypothetical protein